MSGFCEHINTHSFPIKGGKLLYQSDDYNYFLNRLLMELQRMVTIAGHFAVIPTGQDATTY